MMPSDWPVTGGTWTQAATQTNLIYGEVSVREPDACTGSGFLYGYAGVAVYWSDGWTLQPAATATFNWTPEMQGRTATVLLNSPSSTARSAPGADTPRHLTATAFDNCAGAGENFTLESLKVDVIGVS